MAEHTEIQVNPKHPRYIGIKNVLSMIVPDTHVFVAFRANIRAENPDDVHISVARDGYYGLMTYEDYARWWHHAPHILSGRYHFHMDECVVICSPPKKVSLKAEAAVFQPWVHTHERGKRGAVAEALEAEQGRTT